MRDQIIGNLTLREDNELMSLLFHPQEQILLAADVTGCLHFNLFDLDSKICSFPEGMAEKPFQPHKKGSCRSIDLLSSEDSKIVTGGSDGRVVISSFDPQIVSKYKFSNPINVVQSLTESLILAGDDEGALFGIDVREPKNVFTIHEQEDYISAICPALPSVSPLKAVISTSGDCTLAVHDLRVIGNKKNKASLVAMSDPQEDELNCCIVLNQEQHVLTGDANGVVGIWKQGYWGDLKDRLPLYQRSEGSRGAMDGSHSIDGMKKINEKEYVLVTSDGIIRNVNLFPNEVNRVVGVHQNEDDSQVATISAFDCDLDLGLVATSAGDSKGRIKFWSLKKTIDSDQNPDNEEDTPLPKKGNKIHRSSVKSSNQSFFSDL